MKTQQRILGIDMGGTSIRAGLVENGLLGEVLSIPTPADALAHEVVEAIAGLISSFCLSTVDAIGIGVPTIVDVNKGIVYNATNIKDWKEVPLKHLLEDRFHLPVFINNDANCFVSGELFFGKAKGYHSVVGLVLGTGLGAGLIINGRLYEGNNCGAGELGNLPFREHTYEYYCSGQYFRDELNVPAYEVSRLAGQNDQEALQLFETFGTNLGKFMQAVLYAYDPQLIIFGGSVSNAFPFFREAMFRSLKEGFIFQHSLDHLSVVVSELDHIAVYGAASLAFGQPESNKQV
ncbi:MAG: ROK family protein [Bacteroidota bacterium]|nr:ROK family protein [Bacteroidota bacterium]